VGTAANSSLPGPRARPRTGTPWALWTATAVTSSRRSAPGAAAALALPAGATLTSVAFGAVAYGGAPSHRTGPPRPPRGTVVACIRRRRMERVRHLLIASTLAIPAIPAIAATVGIPDLQAFDKTCRRELGASPRAVRAAAGA
jgi:AraC-like DNA-binding protein